MLSTIFAAAAQRARIDFAGTFAEIDGLFYSRGLRAAPMPPELAIARGRMGVVSASPLFESLSIVVHPKPEIDAPMLLADLRVLPNGVTRAFFDACGSTAGEFDALFRKPLSQTLDAAVASAVRRKRVPEWLDRVSSGAGAQLGAAPGRGHVVQHALVRYVERWLDGVERAGTGDPVVNAKASQMAADVFRANGRAGKIIARLYGADFAARYAGLVWNV